MKRFSSIFWCLCFLLFNLCVDAKPIRIAADAGVHKSSQIDDINRGTTAVSFVRGDAVSFEIGLFDGGDFLTNLTAFASLTFELFPAQNNTNLLMYQVVTNGTALWNGNCTSNGWSLNPPPDTNYSVQFYFPGIQTSIPLNGQPSQTYWVRVFATAADTSVVTFLEGPLTVYDGPINQKFTIPFWSGLPQFGQAYLSGVGWIALSNAIPVVPDWHFDLLAWVSAGPGFLTNGPSGTNQFGTGTNWPIRWPDLTTGTLIYTNWDSLGDITEEVYTYTNYSVSEKITRYFTYDSAGNLLSGSDFFFNPPLTFTPNWLTELRQWVSAGPTLLTNVPGDVNAFGTGTNWPVRWPDFTTGNLIYTSDDLGDITTETLTYTNGGIFEKITRSFTYDASGNLLGSSDFQYNPYIP